MIYTKEEKNKIQNLAHCLNRAWFTQKRNANSRNTRCWCYENLHAIYEISKMCKIV